MSDITIRYLTMLRAIQRYPRTTTAKRLRYISRVHE